LFLTWKYRFPLIKQQLDFDDWDFIVLQEVDKYEEIQAHLKTRNYQGTLAMKPDGLMGCALFWNSVKF
jgi:mRNA deadenylase 3'-5' endonuclease subunit Ccr4